MATRNRSLSFQNIIWLSILVAMMGTTSACARPEAASADEEYVSKVDVAPDGGTQWVDLDNGFGILGFVGTPFNARITYNIGWETYTYSGGSSATVTSSRSAVNDPEYYAFCYEDSPSSCGTAAAGISFDTATGVFSGTPTVSLKTVVHGAVRDKENGENPYRGNGVWWTDYQSSDGKTWIEADQKDGTPILIVPKPNPDKQVHLRCALSPSAFGEVLLNLDYDIGYVEVLDATGKIGGFYHIDPTSTTLGWPRLGKITWGLTGVTLDRTSGTINVQLRDTMADGTTQATGQCIKRSTTLSF